MTARPSTANLLAAAGYAGADLSRKVTALHRMIGERHGPVVARDGLRTVCPSCRTTGGRQHPFPCPTWVETSLIFGWTYPARMFEAFGAQVPAELIEATAKPDTRRSLTVAPATHPYAGTDSERQSVGLPGHCDDCVKVGHVRAHPDLGCGDVGCTVGHSPDDPADQQIGED